MSEMAPIAHVCGWILGSAWRTQHPDISHSAVCWLNILYVYLMLPHAVRVSVWLAERVERRECSVSQTRIPHPYINNELILNAL